MKPIKDVLRSPRFMREVSVLLFVFAGFNVLVGVILLQSASTEPDGLASGVGSLIVAVLNLVLGLFVRGGSVKALLIVGVLFVVDTLVLLVQPGGKAGLVGRLILVYVLVGFIRRERRGT